VGATTEPQTKFPAIAAGSLSAVIDHFSRQYPRAIVGVTPADIMAQEFRQLRERRVEEAFQASDLAVRWCGITPIDFASSTIITSRDAR
jgi:hypothetical protein